MWGKDNMRREMKEQIEEEIMRKEEEVICKEGISLEEIVQLCLRRNMYDTYIV